MTLPYPEEGMEFECPERYKYKNNIDPAFDVNLDWRSRDENHLGIVAVTAVKDQASCGSCYVFSSVGAMEGSLCMQGHYDCAMWSGLSEQQLLDCGAYKLSDGVDREWYDYWGCS